MNSFYGGKQGSSFIIAQTYTTIQEMLDDFGKNNRSCAVNFDEYVLINTVNKNNPENGQVFRRGYDYNSSRKIKTYQPTYGPNPYETIEVPANGAIYIGTIVGPAGRAPIFNFGNYEEVQDSCALLTRTFTDIGLNKDDSQQTIVTTLNKNYPNGKEILKEEESEKSFYSLKIVDNVEAPSIYLYFCYDNKYKLSNQEYGGWYAVDSRPSTGEDEYRIETNSLVPGVTYSYDETNNSLIYEYDKDKNRHIKLGINKINEDKINKGKEIEAEDMPYQDSIDWTYCTIRNENLEDSTAYVGFRFAYPVVEFETKQVSAYHNRNDKTDEEGDDKATRHFDNVNLITRMVRDYAVDEEGNLTDVVENRPATKNDIEKHPFYSLWEIAIPKGIKGDCIHNFRVIAANENVKAFDLKDGELQYNENNLVKVKNYSEHQQDDIEKKRKIFVFDFVSYDRIPTGDMQTIYAGDYNVFAEKEAINLSHNGELTFTYTHDDQYKTPEEDWIHWIDAMKFADDGTITITFNDRGWNGNKNIDIDITPHDDIINGVLTKDKLIKWINKVSLDTDNGEIYIEFNNNTITGEHIKTKNIGTDEDPKEVSYYQDYLTWVKDITFDDFGTVTTDYTTEYNGEGKNDEGNRVQKHLIHWIKQMNFADDGTLTVNFNNNSLNDGQIENGNITLPQLIKWITEVKLNKENGKFEIDFNYPEKTNKDGSVIPNTKTHYETDLTWVKDITFKTDGTVITDYTTEYDGEDKDENGNRVQQYLMSWINQMAFNDDGTVIINFNNNSLNDGQINQGILKKEKLINWINHISLDKETGRIYIEFNNDSIVGENISKKTINTEEGSKEVSYYQDYLTWVKDITFDENGTITTDYTTDFNEGVDKRVQSQLIKWIKEVSLNEDNGHFNITFNQFKENEDGTLSDEFQQYNNNLQWIKNIEIDNHGTVKYDGTQQDYSQNKLIKWINEFSLDEDDGHLVIKFNNDQFNTGQVEQLDDENQISIIDKKLTWVKDIQIDPNDGQVTIDYTNLDNDTNTKLQWIKNITIANDGTVEYDGTQQDSTQEKLLTWITSCSFNETTGNLKVNFNNNKTVNNINTTINFIKQVAVTPTGQVLVLYSDPNKQGTISYNGINGWTQMSQLSYSQYLSVDSTDTTKNNVINNLTPGASCYWIEEIE